MRVIKEMLSNIGSKTFDIGFVGEKNHTCVMINCVSLFNQYPDAAVTMVARPPAGDIYPVVLHRDGVFVVWNVSESDIANAGSGQYQLTFTDGEGDNAEIIKTVYGSFSVKPSMVSNGEPPEPIEDWLEEANEALAEFGKINELSASATTLPAGQQATAEITNVNGHKNIAIGIPKGDKGDKGDDGDPAPAEEVTAAVDAYLAENFSNPSNPPLDRSLSSSSSAAPADMVGDLKSALETAIDVETTERANADVSLQQAIDSVDADKVCKPLTNPDGTDGQILRTNGDGTTTWVDQGEPTDEQVAEAVTSWLDDHPEAVTTVEDGAITRQKLHGNLQDEGHFLLSFITPSYGESSYYPYKYALGISYDGYVFNEVIGTENCAGDDFRGGADAMITKVGDTYIIIADCGSTVLNNIFMYVTTKDFRVFSEMNYFNAYAFSDYVIENYNAPVDIAKRIWEPELFKDKNGNLYVTASVGYAEDDNYDPDVNDQIGYKKFFRQLYAPIAFDEQTGIISAVTGGTISEIPFPSGMTSVIDGQVLWDEDNEYYYYLYKDRISNTCNIATFDDLGDTPVDIEKTLIGRSFSENPWMVSFGDYKLIYVTNYDMLTSPADLFAVSTSDLSNYITSRCNVHGNVMGSGEKCRSLHPILMQDNDIISYLAFERGTVIGGSNPSEVTYNDPLVYQIDKFCQYYGLKQSVENGATYMVPEWVNEIRITNKWFTTNGFIGFKRLGTWSNSKAVNVKVFYGSDDDTPKFTNPVTISNRGIISIYSVGSGQSVLEHDTKVFEAGRNGITMKYYRTKNDETLKYVYTGTLSSAHNAGEVTTLSDSKKDIPSSITEIQYVPFYTVEGLKLLKLDPSVGITIIYVTGCAANSMVRSTGIIYTT